MKKLIFGFGLILVCISCGNGDNSTESSGNSEKDRITELLKERIGNKLPFDEVKICTIKQGTGVIVDGSWCYWIDANNKIYCVNGTGKSVYDLSNEECEYAPGMISFSDIEAKAK